MFKRWLKRSSTIEVEASWDDEAKVWVATSKDVPGLAIEANNMEALMADLKVMIPELLQENGMQPDRENCLVPFHVRSERTETVNACA